MLSSFALTSDTELFATECRPNMTAEHCYVNSWPFCVKHLVNEVFLCVHHMLTALCFLFWHFQCRINKTFSFWYEFVLVMLCSQMYYKKFRMHSMQHSCLYCCYFIQGQLLASFTERVCLVLSVMHNMPNKKCTFLF